MATAQCDSEVLAASQVPGLTLRLLLWPNRLLGPASTSAALLPKLRTAAMRSPLTSAPNSSAALLAIACRHGLGQAPRLSGMSVTSWAWPCHGARGGMQLP